MLTRSLLVMLIVLNMAVALWWGLHTPPAPSLPVLATDVAVLELLPLAAGASEPEPSMPIIPSGAEISAAVDVESLTEPELEQNPAQSAQNSSVETTAEIPVQTSQFPETPEIVADIATNTVPAEAEMAQAPPDSAPQRCISLGPFTELTQAQAGLQALGRDVARSQLREVAGHANTRYRILIPPAPTREQAQAEVERIAAAGFSDYFIISEGEDTHAIALGQFRNREGAQRRLAELTTAGFPAQLRTTVEDPRSSWWIDTALAAAVTPAALQRRSNAAGRHTLDCARLP